MVLAAAPAQACPHWHDDGVALWCCPGEAGVCVLVGYLDDEVPA